MLLEAAAIGAGIYLLTRGKAATEAVVVAKNLMSDITKLQFKNWGLTELTFNVVLEHTNPTNAQLTIDNINVDGFIDNNKIAAIRIANANFVIGAQKTVTQTLPIKIRWLGLGSAILAIGQAYLTTGSLPQKALMKGFVTGNGFTVPITKEIAISR